MLSRLLDWLLLGMRPGRALLSAFALALASRPAVAAAPAPSSISPLGGGTPSAVSVALVSRALGWANTKGLQMSPQPGVFVHAPLSLTPFPLSATEFERARALAPAFNTLVEAIAADPDWLLEVLDATLASDPFTARLAQVLRDLRTAGGEAQPLHLGIHRSDYMLDEPARADGAGFAAPRLQQIELNTIAASFGCLSAKISGLHTYLCAVAADDVAAVLEPSAAAELAAGARLPPNSALEALPDALAAAHAAYVDQAGLSIGEGTLPVALFVVQPGEGNVADQRMLELALYERHGVQTLRCTLGEIATDAELRNGPSRGGPRPCLYVRGLEVAVAYFRAGYGPDDYLGEAEWGARLTVERSAAIKCPTVSYQLVGTKKVQQVLSEPGVLERFVAHPAEAAAVRATFAGLYSLQTDAEYEHALQLTRDDPEGFVLKPQREGGGNNVYGRAATEKLSGMRAGERKGYILMELIRPRPRQLALARKNEVTLGQAVCELGVYSVFLGGGGQPPLLNEVAGHLLRAKLLGTDEGGVAAGFAVLSSPLLEN